MGNVKCLVLKDTGHVLTNQTNNILQFLNSLKSEI